MSYCRWSSDNWKSDVYCYESNDGFVTHVAANRIVGEVPPVVWPPAATQEQFVASHKAASAFLGTAEHRPIGLPYDGKTFTDASADDMAVTLRMLVAAGYHVPAGVIDGLVAEGRETSGEET